MAYAQATLACVVVFIVSRVVNYIKYRRDTGYLPGIRSLFSPLSPLGAFIPTSRFNPGLNWFWEWRTETYARAGTETISAVPYLFGSPVIYTSSLEVARQVLSTRENFYKSDDTVAITLIWGPNIFAESGDEWRRHRRILSPAFDNATYNSVWRESSRVVDEMVVAEGWTHKSLVNLSAVNPLTNKFAMILISTCGFGHSLPWDFGGSSHGKMSFGEAMTFMTNNHLLHLVLPHWAYQLPVKKFQQVGMAAKTLRTFMNELIWQRRKDMASGEAVKHDILSLMIQSSEREGKYKMTDSELMGNTFLLLSAGHDTAARTLDAALGFLALNEDFQDEVYDEIMNAMPTEADFTFENSSKLKKTQACFLEAARIYPAGYMVIRDTAQDVVLRNIGPNRDQVLPLRRDMSVVVDMIGLHHNPRLFPDPEEFKPERWYDVHENNLSMFAVGARACIGRRFAITEGVCFIARLLRQWKIRILTRQGESKAEWKVRVMRGQAFTNFGVVDVPISLVRRE